VLATGELERLYSGLSLLVSTTGDGIPCAGLAVFRSLARLLDDGLGAEEAVARPRLHFEDGRVDAEPGVDPATLRALDADGYAVRRWAERNLYFGGVQAVARDPETGELSGGGDPRRGGSAVLAG